MIFRELMGRFICGSSFSLVAVLCCGQAIADVIPDGSLGVERSVVLPNTLIRGDLANEIRGGAARGDNLFHSFSDFSVGNGQRVYFANPNAINQIFTRVTGATASDIFGTLGVNGSADLYLINPNGIHFGDSASLDIAGSFAATTTKSIAFADGFVFGTDISNAAANPILTVSQPLGLAAWTTPQADITNRAQLVAGNDLTLFGNSLDLEGSVWSGGELGLFAADTIQIRDRLNSPFTTLSVGNQNLQAETIDIFALSHPDSGLYSYGDLVLRSPNPIIIDAYFNSLGNFSLENTNGLAGDALSPNDPVIRSSGDVTFGTYSGASLHVFAGGSIQTGAITITSPDGINGLQETVTLSDGSTTVNIDGRNVATLDLRAGTNSFGGNSVTGLFNFPAIPTPSPCNSSFCTSFPAPTSILQNFAATPTPTAADITIESLAFSNGLINNFAFISNQYDPNTNGIQGGDILLGMLASGTPGEIKLNTSTDFSLVVDSRNDIVVFGEIKPDTAGLDVGEILMRAGGDISVDNLIENVGNISIFADTLTAKNGNQIKASTVNAKNAGTIFVQANRVEFSGTDSNGVFSGLSSIAGLGSTGNAGMIQVEAGLLSLSDGAQIRTSTLGSGDAGIVKVTATGAIAIDGGKIINTPSGPEPAPSGIISEVGASSTGNGQLIDIKTKQLTLTNGGIISAATAGAGNAGQTKVVVDGTATFSGNPGTPLFPSGIFTESLASATGAGGNIDFRATDLNILNGATFKSSTQSANKAGDITVAAINAVNIIGADTGIFADTSSSTVTGSGGKVTVSGRNLNLSNGGRISSITTGAAKAGDIAAIFSNDVAIAGAGTGIFADTSSSNAANGSGGQIAATSQNLALTTGGKISSSASGAANAGDIKVDVSNDITVSGKGSGVFAATTSTSTGNGGSIDIDPIFIRLNDAGQFSVSAQGTGVAGNIRVVGDFLILDNGFIDASSQTGSGGNLIFDIGQYILLQNGSNITTNAGLGSGGGNGGNMTIRSPFVIATPNQDNNITANAFDGNGGNIEISTNALFGISFNTEDISVRNDITVSSKLGLDGEFILNSPDTDPSSGLAKLITGLSDPNDKVVQACSSEEVNSYTVTGRGGLAADPSSTVRGSSLLSDVRDFSGVSGEEISESSSVEAVAAPQQILQATNFAVGEQGIELVASRTIEHHKTTASNCR